MVKKVEKGNRITVAPLPSLLFTLFPFPRFPFVSPAQSLREILFAVRGAPDFRLSPYLGHTQGQFR
jgi:hypothetical protein